MRTYLVCKPDSEPLIEEVKSWIDDDIDDDVVVFTNSVSALEDIKIFKKPCIVFIQASKVAINGSNFLKMVKNLTPYTHVFVMCEGEQSHNAILHAMDLDENEFVCDNMQCYAVSHEAVEDRNKQLIKDVIGQAQLVEKMDIVVGNIKNKVNMLEKRTKRCAQKLQMIS